MRIARAKVLRGKRYGLLDEKGHFYPLSLRLVEICRILRKQELLETLLLQEESVPPDEYTLLAPCKPSKIIAVGLNYRDHAAEFGKPVPEEPVLFLKPPSSLIGPGESIVIPPQAKRVDYEAELAVIVGRKAKRVSAEEAPAYILGYACANDVTERHFQKIDGQWTRAKSFDTFCPLGPWIETEFDPYQPRDISAFVNGKRRQKSTTINMIWGPHELFSFVSHVMTLRPGDVILTGTPAGVGELKPGDTVTITVEGIGELTNPVISG